MAEIVMPRLSDTMEEGTVLRWLKRDGEHVRRGEELVEIETDKAAMVYESDQQGLLRIVVQEGDTLAVGATIAHVAETAETAGAAGGHAEPQPTPPSTATPPTSIDSSREQPRADPVKASSGGTSPTPSDSGREQRGAERATAPPSNSTPPAPADSGRERQEAGRVKASPLARRVAHERDVDLHTLMGSGPGGRIVKADVEAASRPVAPEATGRPAAAPESTTLLERVASAKGETTVVELTRTQQTIARRMAESKATIPDFALQAEIDMEQCVALRAELKRLSPEAAPTYNDMVVKACALALREHPRANGSYRDGRLQLHSRVNVGVAVAVDSKDPSGGALVVPTVFDADLKALGEIARETRALAERVRSGTITPPELGGGTFTVSNLGMYGVRSFTAIINPPQAAILSIGSLEPRATVRDGEIVARHTLLATLACDHRILYGADAARFLARVRELLQAPAALTL
jgi:pyruvate dehydrogenase E2 component (dihydrolipoamide acetyltransferase)